MRGYNVPLPVLETGGAAQTMPLNGRVPVASRPDLIQSARDTLFTSGSLGPVFAEAELRDRDATRFVCTIRRDRAVTRTAQWITSSSSV